MPFLFIWMLIEILIFSRFTSLFGFGQTLGAYIIPSFLGIYLLSQFKNLRLNQLRSTWQQGKEPTTEVLHITAQILGSALLLPPSFFTRILGLALVLPGLRHICVRIVKMYFIKKILRPGSRFFKAGS